MQKTLEKNFDYFLSHNFKEFEEGEWVAIYKNKVISHDRALKQVLDHAKRIAPLSDILLSKVKKTASFLQY